MLCSIELHLEEKDIKRMYCSVVRLARLVSIIRTQRVFFKYESFLQQFCFHVTLLCKILEHNFIVFLININKQTKKSQVLNYEPFGYTKVPVFRIGECELFDKLK